MKTHRLISILSFNILPIFLLAGCVVDPVSWSPDGRYLAYVGSTDQRLCVLDSQTHEVKTLSDDSIVACRFLPNGQEILYGAGAGKDNEVDFYKVDINTGEREYLVPKASFYFDTSDDGRFLYYIKSNENNGADLWEKDLITKQDARLLGQESREIQCVDADPAGNRFLMTMDDCNIVLWEKGQADCRVLEKKEGGNLVFPQWLDATRYFYIDMKKDSDTGNLMLDSIDAPNPKILIENVYTWDLPSLSPDKKSVFVTQKTNHDFSQLVKITLENGENTVIIPELNGNNWAIPDPSGEQIALFSGDDNSSLLRVFDLKSGKIRVAWRDAEERLVAIVESLRQSEDYPLAIGVARDLIEQFPNSRLVDFAYLRILQMYLIPSNLNVDKAFDAWNCMPRNNAAANSLFWKEADRSADDPAEDWIAQYGTEEAKAKFEFNTDLTRDLLGLSVKCSDKRVFFKIDYNSNRDLSGLTFGDTLILLDFDSPNEGLRKISDRAEWERGAERVIVLRHWYKNGCDSQYDAAVLNNQGENVTHFLASGFEPPNLPHFEVIELQDGDRGSIVVSVNKDVLDLTDHKKVFIQVCTLKGGLESFEGKERPLVPLLDGKLVCDVADAFGADNTAERILAEAKAGKPAIIHGYAAEITVGN